MGTRSDPALERDSCFPLPAMPGLLDRSPARCQPVETSRRHPHSRKRGNQSLQRVKQLFPSNLNRFLEAIEFPLLGTLEIFYKSLEFPEACSQASSP